MPTLKQERERRFHERHPNWRADTHRQRRYGISPEQFQAMLDEQAGGCALCGNVNRERALYVDHDHVTGKVRGLLCASCNKSLGTFCDDPEFLRLAATYVEA